jgi:hypothetical protein
VKKAIMEKGTWKVVLPGLGGKRSRSEDDSVTRLDAVSS